MKVYSAKTLEEALEAASKDMNLPQDQLMYEVTEEVKGLFKKSVQISVYDIYDEVEYVESFLEKMFTTLGIEVHIKTRLDDATIIVDLTSDKENSTLIGRQGMTLNAIVNLTRAAVSKRFRKFVSVQVDVGGYRAKRYDKIEHLARIWGKSVLRSRQDMTLDPLPPDERRLVHQVISGFRDLESKSEGEGRLKKLTIIYKGSKEPWTPRNKFPVDEEKEPEDLEPTDYISEDSEPVDDSEE